MMSQDLTHTALFSSLQAFAKDPIHFAHTGRSRQNSNEPTSRRLQSSTEKIHPPLNGLAETTTSPALPKRSAKRPSPRFSARRTDRRRPPARTASANGTAFVTSSRPVDFSLSDDTRPKTSMTSEATSHSNVARGAPPWSRRTVFRTPPVPSSW